MQRPSSRRLPPTLVLLALLGVSSAVFLGLWLRADDPLTNPVMAAEDPYTHMSLVREHLRDGKLDPQTRDGSLYPPGLHAVIGALWVYTGADLYELMRFAPILCGVICIAGLALVAGRWDGLLAGFGGALAVAVMPEEIARTTMMSPTALDLALLPFLLMAMLEMLRGKLAWGAPALVITSFLVISHPWTVAVLNLAGFGFIVLYVAFPWRAHRGPPVRREGVALAVAILGAGFGLALGTRWQASGTGFSELTLPLFGNNVGSLGIAAVASAGILAAILALLPRMTRKRLPRLNGRPRPTAFQLLGVVGIAVFLAALTQPALEHGMPPLVDLPRMIGLPLLALAAFAVITLPVASSPAQHVGAALFMVSYPFTIYNPLESEFWPSRTVVFFGLGVAILAGCAVRRIVEGITWAADAVNARRARKDDAVTLARPALGIKAATGPASLRSRAVSRGAATQLFALVAPALLVGTLFLGSVFAAEPPPYPGGWYRYYNTCEFEALRHVADYLNANPKAMAVATSWEAQLVTAAFTNDGGRVWFKKELFQPGYDVGSWLKARQRENRTVYIIVERHVSEEIPTADLGFLQQAPWTLLDQQCPGQGMMAWKFQLYQSRGG